MFRTLQESDFIDRLQSSPDFVRACGIVRVTRYKHISYLVVDADYLFTLMGNLELLAEPEKLLQLSDAFAKAAHVDADTSYDAEK